MSKGTIEDYFSIPDLPPVTQLIKTHQMIQKCYTLDCIEDCDIAALAAACTVLTRGLSKLLSEEDNLNQSTKAV